MTLDQLIQDLQTAKAKHGFTGKEQVRCHWRASDIIFKTDRAYPWSTLEHGSPGALEFVIKL